MQEILQQDEGQGQPKVAPDAPATPETPAADPGTTDAPAAPEAPATPETPAAAPDAPADDADKPA